MTQTLIGKLHYQGRVIGTMESVITPLPPNLRVVMAAIRQERLDRMTAACLFTGWSRDRVSEVMPHNPFSFATMTGTGKLDR